MQVQATFTLPRQSTGPRASAAGCISMVPYSPADAGIHNPPGEGQTVFDGVVCEQLQAINPEVTPALATLQLTEEIPKLWDPKSDKVIEFAKCVSAAIGLVPGPSPTVEVLGIAFGGVEPWKATTPKPYLFRSSGPKVPICSFRPWEL
jgi:hypothetical protein